MIAEKIKSLIKKAGESLGMELGDVHLEHPDILDHGDYATNVALALAKSAAKSPKAIAEELKTEIEKDLPKEISKVEVAGPGFLNFYLSREFFAESVGDILKDKDTFGLGDIYKDETWEIEYASPNPNKAMHLGHLRNVVTGLAVSNIVEAVGAKVIRDMVDNNRGIAIAKLMWGYLKFARKEESTSSEIGYWRDHKDLWFTPDEKGIRPDRFVDDLYVKGSEDAKDPEISKTVRGLVVAWENRDSLVWELWKHVLQYSYDGQKMTLDRLGAKFDYVWHEHEHYEKGKQYVKEGLAKGVFEKLEDGAILTRLFSYGLSDTIVEKNDGTALYITQDIALTDLKKKKFNADKQVWIIGPEQSLAMKQVFAVCDALGIGKFSDFIHIPYGYMSIKGKGKMSSREGTVIYIDEVINESKEIVRAKIKEGFTDDEREEIAEKVAVGAVKFSLLKVSRMGDISFDFDTSLDFNGDSGPYLQYALVRSFAISDKAESLGIKASSDNPFEEAILLEKILYRFPEIVEKAATFYEPTAIATYLVELVSAFNRFYAENTIVSDAPDSPYRVAITEAFGTVMERGLRLLGIPVLEKM